MRNDDRLSGKATSVTPRNLDAADRKTVSGTVRALARRSGAGLTPPKSNPGAMCEQGQDWSRGNSCIPQKFVRLIGHRDPDARPSSPLPQRPMIALKKPVPSDTPIG